MFIWSGSSRERPNKNYLDAFKGLGGSGCFFVFFYQKIDKKLESQKREFLFFGIIHSFFRW